MTTKVNILNTPDPEGSPLLSLVRLDQNETPVIFFTPEGEISNVHYCEDPEISSYVLCNPPDCILCRVGKHYTQRFLLPVYQPLTDTIGVLAMTMHYRPYALYPQIKQILRIPKPMVVFIQKTGYRYSISTSELQPDMQTGEPRIAQYKKESESGQIQLMAVYPRLDNAQFADLPSVDRLLRLKGITLYASDTGTESLNPVSKEVDGE